MNKTNNISQILVNQQPKIKGNSLMYLVEFDTTSLFVLFDIQTKKITNLSYFVNGNQLYVSKQEKNILTNTIISHLNEMVPKTFNASINLNIYGLTSTEANTMLQSIVNSLKANYDCNAVGQLNRMTNHTFKKDFNLN
jgi:hypothetical protein